MEAVDKLSERDLEKMGKILKVEDREDRCRDPNHHLDNNGVCDCEEQINPLD